MTAASRRSIPDTRATCTRRRRHAGHPCTPRRTSSSDDLFGITSESAESSALFCFPASSRPRADDSYAGAVTAVRDLTWRIAPGQRLVFEDMDDGVLLYDSLVGRTHLLNATAAETLTVLERNPGLTSDAIRRHVTEAL